MKKKEKPKTSQLEHIIHKDLKSDFLWRKPRTRKNIIIIIKQMLKQKHISSNLERKRIYFLTTMLKIISPDFRFHSLNFKTNLLSLLNLLTALWLTNSVHERKKKGRKFSNFYPRFSPWINYQRKNNYIHIVILHHPNKKSNSYFVAFLLSTPKHTTT